MDELGSYASPLLIDLINKSRSVNTSQLVRHLRRLN